MPTAARKAAHNANATRLDSVDERLAAALERIDVLEAALADVSNRTVGSRPVDKAIERFSADIRRQNTRMSESAPESSNAKHIRDLRAKLTNPNLNADYREQLERLLKIEERLAASGGVAKGSWRPSGFRDPARGAR